jgi:hypothetical protein
MHQSVCCLLAGAFALSIGGCCSAPRPALAQTTPTETLVFTLGPVDPPRQSHIGHIVATNSLNTNQTVRVLVMGSVNNPGWVNAPEGTTALGAIKRAGGFVRIGASYYLRIMRGTTTYAYVLATEPLGPEFPNEYRIWYGPYEWSQMRQRNVVNRHSRSDVVLQDGDKVFVPGV